MRATRPARALGWLVEAVDRYWGPIGVAIVVALEVFVFGPRGMFVPMIIAGAVGSGIAVGWLLDRMT